MFWFYFSGKTLTNTEFGTKSGESIVRNKGVEVALEQADV